jgi:hypothetical protein
MMQWLVFDFAQDGVHHDEQLNRYRDGNAYELAFL